MIAPEPFDASEPADDLDAAERQMLQACRRLRAAVALLDGVNPEMQRRVFEIHAQATAVVNELRS